MERRRIARSASAVGLATLVSRVLGLARDMIILKVFPPMLTDAFYAAFRLPSTLRYLMGEGALSAAFIPVFSDYLRNRTRREAWELVASVAVVLTAVTSFIALLGILFAPWIVRAALWGFAADAEKFQITVELTRWLFPYLIFVSLVALCMGVLNSLRHFAMPSLSQAAFNAMVIFSALCIAPRWGARPQERIVALALGVLFGGAVQVGMQIPALRRKGFILVFGRVWTHPELRRIARLMLPATAGLAVYHVNLLVDNLVASFLPQGSVTYLYAATRLIQFPMGTFVIGISTVAFPLMAGYAVAGEVEKLKEAMNYALRLALFIVVPAAAGLVVLGRPIIGLLYDRGEFLAAGSAGPTYWALIFYSLGLFAVGGVAVVVRCFYSIEDTRTPVRVACAAVAVNIVLDFALMVPLKHGGIALATSISSCVNLSLLLWLLRKRVGALGLRRVGVSLAKIAAATVAMAAASWAAHRGVAAVAAGGGIGPQAFRVFVPLAAGVAVYLAAARAAGAPELGELLHEFRRRGH